MVHPPMIASPKHGLSRATPTLTKHWKYTLLSSNICPVISNQPNLNVFFTYYSNSTTDMQISVHEEMSENTFTNARSTSMYL